MDSPAHKVVVRSLPADENLTITLDLAGKLRNLSRQKTELLEKPLQRLQKLAAPPVKGGNRKPGKGKAAQDGGTAAAPPPAPPQQVAPAEELCVALHSGPTSDCPALDAAATSNEDAWQHGRLLVVAEQRFLVELNPPTVDRVEVPGSAFVGVPLCPLVALHFSEEQVCRWQWFRQVPGAERWEPIEGAVSKLYTPCEEDAGCMLRVECTPARRALLEPSSSEPSPQHLIQGEAVWAVVSSGPVRALPCPLGAQARLALTEQRAQAPEFRVVTYNILADTYASTDVAKAVLFKHCLPEFMAPEYRRPLVVAELLGFKGDVLCLQEVDEKMFTHYLQPQLGEAGYQGMYTNKAGKAREGCATFFKTDRFKLVAQQELTLKDFFPATLDEPSPYADTLGPMLQSSPELLITLKRVLTVAQLVLLAPSCDPQGLSRPLLVANTHLFYHHQAPHIRTLHAWVILQEAHRLAQRVAADKALSLQLCGKEPSMLLCGDLNSSLNNGVPGVIELLHKGRVAPDHWDWLFGFGFDWTRVNKLDLGEGDGERGGASSATVGELGEVSKMVHTNIEHARPSASNLGEEVIPGVELASPFELRAADDLKTPFSNYVPGYQGLLDYIWYCPKAVEVVREVPLSSLQEINERFGGPLPSRHFPSDHLPLVFDLRFRQEQTGGGSGA